MSDSLSEITDAILNEVVADVEEEEEGSSVISAVQDYEDQQQVIQKASRAARKSCSRKQK